MFIVYNDDLYPYYFVFYFFGVDYVDFYLI